MSGRSDRLEAIDKDLGFHIALWNMLMFVPGMFLWAPLLSFVPAGLERFLSLCILYAMMNAAIYYTLGYYQLSQWSHRALRIISVSMSRAAGRERERRFVVIITGIIFVSTLASYIIKQGEPVFSWYGKHRDFDIATGSVYAIPKFDDGEWLEIYLYPDKDAYNLYGLPKDSAAVLKLAPINLATIQDGELGHLIRAANTAFIKGDLHTPGFVIQSSSVEQQEAVWLQAHTFTLLRSPLFFYVWPALIPVLSYLFLILGKARLLSACCSLVAVTGFNLLPWLAIWSI
ncbi:hypothetical protein ACP3V5_17635 [Vibrio maritimus]